MSVPLIVLGIVALFAIICLLALVVAGLAMNERDEATGVILDIARSLVGLYAFLIALGGAYVLVSKASLARLFSSPVKGWQRFLVLAALTGLLYLPLSFIAGRAFAFLSRGLSIFYSLEQLAEAVFVLLVLGGLFYLLAKQNQEP